MNALVSLHQLSTKVNHGGAFYRIQGEVINGHDVVPFDDEYFETTLDLRLQNEVHVFTVYKVKATNDQSLWGNGKGNNDSKGRQLTLRKINDGARR